MLFGKNASKKPFFEAAKVRNALCIKKFERLLFSDGSYLYKIYFLYVCPSEKILSIDIFF